MMMKFALILVALLAAPAFARVSLTGNGRHLSQQANSEFVAVYSSTAVVADDCTSATDIWGDNSLCVGTDDPSMIDTNMQLVPLGEIKVASQKDLLIGLSAQIELVTVTQSKSTKTGTTSTGSLGTSTATAGVSVEILVKREGGSYEQLAAPGAVVFNSRTQELKVQINGQVTDTEGNILDSTLESLVGLSLSTTSAHSFQFLGIDLPQGTYDVVAKFSLMASATATTGSFAGARVVLGKRMLTVQELRACKDCINEV